MPAFRLLRKPCFGGPVDLEPSLEARIGACECGILADGGTEHEGLESSGQKERKEFQETEYIYISTYQFETPSFYGNSLFSA